jgi:hypothetical protein
MSIDSSIAPLERSVGLFVWRLRLTGLSFLKNAKTDPVSVEGITMKRIYKTFLWIGGSALVAYQAYRATRAILGARKLDHALPEFLENIYGERPKVDINIAMNVGTVMSITIKFSPALLSKSPDIEDEVRDYIRDFYPALAKFKTRIKLMPIEIEEQDHETAVASQPIVDPLD